MEKIHQVIWESLPDYGRIEWKQTLKDLEEAPDVAYQVVLEEFNSVWCVEGVIVTRSKLVVTWKVRPWMGIIS